MSDQDSAPGRPAPTPAGRERRPSMIYSAGLWLMAVGLLLVGYGAWEYWGSNIWAKHQQQETVRELIEAWSESSDADLDGAFGLLRVPALGDDYVVPLIQGVQDDDLSRGVGHYPGTALPGEVGNFAVAGHRVTHGEPFRDFPDLAPGDLVEIETATAIYTYELDNDAGDLVVQPDDTWVLEPVPPDTRYDDGSPEPTEPLLTLTTCGEIFHTSDRMIAFGHLVDADLK